MKWAVDMYNEVKWSECLIAYVKKLRNKWSGLVRGSLGQWRDSLLLEISLEMGTIICLIEWCSLQSIDRKCNGV